MQLQGDVDQSKFPPKLCHIPLKPIPFVANTGVHGRDDDDESPLVVYHPDTNAGVPGAVFNLTNTIIGAGSMALPATTKFLDLLPGAALIIVIGILYEISVELLVRFAILRNAVSYGNLGHSALGRPARILSQLCIVTNSAGVLVVYLIIIGDVVSTTPASTTSGLGTAPHPPGRAPLTPAPLLSREDRLAHLDGCRLVAHLVVCSCLCQGPQW